MILRRCPSCNSVRLEGLFTVCKACSVLTWPGRRVQLGPVGILIVERLALAHGFVRTPDIVEHVYGGREDGGPLTAERCIRDVVGRVRATLRGRGAPFEIIGKEHRGYCIAQRATAPPLTIFPHTGIHVGTARLSAGVIPIGRARWETRDPALFSGAA